MHSFFYRWKHVGHPKLACGLISMQWVKLDGTSFIWVELCPYCSEGGSHTHSSLRHFFKLWYSFDQGECEKNFRVSLMDCRGVHSSTHSTMSWALLSTCYCQEPGEGLGMEEWMSQGHCPPTVRDRLAKGSITGHGSGCWSQVCLWVYRTGALCSGGLGKERTVPKRWKLRFFWPLEFIHSFTHPSRPGT